jgi:hypothetical protein
MNVRRLLRQQPHMSIRLCRLLYRLQRLGVREVPLQDLILLLCVPTLHVSVQARHGFLRLVVFVAPSIVP